jgi:hypothetical protein
VFRLGTPKFGVADANLDEQCALLDDFHAGNAGFNLECFLHFIFSLWRLRDFADDESVVDAAKRSLRLGRHQDDVVDAA